MKYEVVITEKAKTDLRNIYEYIAFQLLSPISAGSLLNRLESRILSLENLPFRFRQYDKEPWRSRGLRVMSVDNFLVFYIPAKESASVTVLRVMYGGREIEKHLK